MRGRRCVPPSISGTPQRRSGKPSVEPSVAIRRSHHSASSRPPARHQPEIAAIVGLDGVRRVKPSGPSGVVEPSAERLDRLQVGAGAEGDAAGAGEHEHARVVVGLEARVAPRAARSAVGPSTALRRSGRSIVTTRGGAAALVADSSVSPDVRAVAPTSRRASAASPSARLLRGLAALPCACPAAAGACSSRTRTAGRRRSG